MLCIACGCTQQGAPFKCVQSDAAWCVAKQVTEFLDAGARQWAFLVEGLKDIPPKLEAFNIPFYMMYGKPEDNIPKLVEDIGATLLVCDYVPLHEAQAWRMDVSLMTLGNIVNILTLLVFVH